MRAALWMGVKFWIGAKFWVGVKFGIGAKLGVGLKVGRGVNPMGFGPGAGANLRKGVELIMGLDL